MSDLGEIVGGGTPSTKIPEYWGNKISWITPADLSCYKQKLIKKGKKSITPLGLEDSSARLIPQGSVLFSSRAPIGYVVIAGNDLSTNQGFKSVVPSKEVFNEYVFYYLKSAKRLADDFASGTTFKEISAKNFAKLPIPLPPLAEQRRIVAKIEELFSDLDAGIASLKQAQAQLKTYRQAVLKYAFEGKLTAAWREQNKPAPAEKLLARIKAEREKQYRQQLAEWQKAGVDNTGKKKPPKPQKPKEFPPLTEAELAELPKLPEGWTWAIMEQISTKVVDGVHKKPNYVLEGIPFITVKNLTAGNDIDFANVKYITDVDHGEYYKRANPEQGDLLITEDGTLGVVKVVKTEKTFSIFVSVALIKPIQKYLNSDFLAAFLTSPFGQQQIQIIGEGSGLQHLHLEDLRALMVAIPSFLEQHQIVQKIESRLSVCDKLEESIKESLHKAEALRQSILKKAFAGKLVPQDPNDEPAEKLLARIRAEKSKTQTRQGIGDKRRQPWARF